MTRKGINIFGKSRATADDKIISGLEILAQHVSDYNSTRD